MTNSCLLCSPIRLQLSSTMAKPCSLVYAIEAVLSIEIEIPSLGGILINTELEETELAHSLFDPLNFIEEKRMAAPCHGHCY